MPFSDYVPVQRFQPSLAVSPDGGTIAYTANTSGQYDLWLVPLTGGNARRLTDFADRAVRTMAWSPDGSSLAFTADQGGDEQHQVYLVDAKGGEPRRITTTDDRQHHLGGDPFSSDGRWIAYAGNDRDPMVQDILLHDLESDTVRRIESEAGLMLFPVEFSPGDDRLLVIGARSNTDSDAFTVDVTTDELTLTSLTAHDGEARNVPAAWTADGAGVYLVTDGGGGEFSSVSVLDVATGTSTPFGPASGIGWDVEDFTVSEDGSVLVWSVNENGMSVLHRQGADGVAGARRDLPPSVIQSLCLTPDGSAAAVLLASATRPSEISVIDLTGDGTPRPLTDSRPPGLLDIAPVEPELVTYPTHDEREIPGWLYRPAGDGPFPAVLSIHGGPEAQERPQYNYAGLYQYLLANGIGVFAPNVRGSTGYGRAYQTLIHRDWGGDELGDFEHANSYLRTLDWVDGDRLAVFGRSFGGFATLSCVSRLPELWAAGVSIVGPSNLQTFVRAVPPTWRSLTRALVGDAEDDALMLAQRSPLTYADQIVAPLLVIQGANDPRVVKAESDQIVESLEDRGVDVRYVVYPDEGHGFTKRENEIDALSQVADFLLARLT